jgi:hypothetical protein
LVREKGISRFDVKNIDCCVPNALWQSLST